MRIFAGLRNYGSSGLKLMQVVSIRGNKLVFSVLVYQDSRD
ncbi:MAG: hypothetical protein ACKPJD_21185 [Planctomycetaceae bacterium]